VVAAQRRRLKCIIARRNGKTARFGREQFPASESSPGITMSAAIAQNQFKTKIDMARSAARQHQLGCGAADGVAMNADSA
jgi:hypothetical protein